jgi:hypothetical protein
VQLVAGDVAEIQIAFLVGGGSFGELKIAVDFFHFASGTDAGNLVGCRG